VFEIVKTASGYASTPTTLVSFNGTNGSLVRAGLTPAADWRRTTRRALPPTSR
jgi:hypothetical protein